MKRYTKGFTLIELLVVIAIIGILASVVLVSLQSARKKGNDSRVISSVQQIRTQLEADYNGSNYSTGITGVDALSSSGNYGLLVTDVNGQGGAINVIAPAGATSYAIYGLLPSTKGGALADQRYFCIDSTGNTRSSTANNTAATCQ